MDSRGEPLAHRHARGLEFRGEIVTVPGRRATLATSPAAPGVHERSPVWSPDGKTIAYFSDASGEYTLHFAPRTARAT